MAGARPKGERLFGTDGIRGTPGTYPLTDGMIFKIGVSIARIILYKNKGSGPFKVVIGRDTRLTGMRIESILSDAITFYGVDVYFAGTITTPGLAFLVKDTGADMGIMISASHNKATDNGIKFFNEKGVKISRHEEEWIENIIFNTLVRSRDNGFHPTRRGKTYSLDDARKRYTDFLISTVKGLDLSGLKVGIDCGWGAASGFACGIYQALGAIVSCIHDKPSGENINEGGAIDPSGLRQLVMVSGLDVGVALDGDGDRCILVDEKGNILDGDYIMAFTALYMMDKRTLARDTLVVTVMSNMGLHVAIKERGGKIIVTPVGDKHVLEALITNNLNLGGEQSGHIIFRDYSPTPDGLLTGLQALKVISDTGKSLAELASCMKKFPQVLVNVPVKEKKPFEEMESVKKQLEYFNDLLKGKGRILLRYSGTERLARVMVEGKDKKVITEIANTLADEIKKEIGATTTEVNSES